MTTPPPHYNLSKRGQTLAGGNDTSEIFEVIRNLYHPSTNPNGFLNLGVAENDMLHPKLTAYIERTFSLPSEYLTYYDGGAGSRTLQSALARFLTRKLHPVNPILPEHTVITNGCSSIIEGLSNALCDPGEGILIGQPLYRSFLPDIEMRPGSRVVKVAFGSTDPFSVAAVAHYEAAIHTARESGTPIRALLLCHPHNPLGRCYPIPTLKALMELCQQHRIHFISDEIYALSTWANPEYPDATPFTSVSAIDTAGLVDPHLVHIVWGMSKDFGANGLRIGSLISQANPAVLVALGTCGLYTYPSNVADRIASTVLSDDGFVDAYIEENSRLLASRYQLITRVLEENGIEYKKGANAAFFVTVDLGGAWKRRHGDGGGDGEDAMKTVKKRLLEERVYVADSNAIASEVPGWCRVVFSVSEESLLEGLRRIVAAIESGGGRESGRSDIEANAVEEIKDDTGLK